MGFKNINPMVFRIYISTAVLIFNIINLPLLETVEYISFLIAKRKSLSYPLFLNDIKSRSNNTRVKIIPLQGSNRSKLVDLL